MKRKIKKVFKIISREHIIWQAPLAAVFLCFGILLMAQYYTHVAENDSLQNESTANLAMIIKTQNDNKQMLEAQLDSLNEVLSDLQSAVDSGDSLAVTLLSRIDSLEVAVGVGEMTGSGISLTITSSTNLIYQDLIDIVNELFNAGAEAVSINDTRFTLHTLISEEARIREVTNNNGIVVKEDYYVITVDGRELLAPIIIRAIGDQSTLESALTYPGGIISSLNTLYDIYPTIRKSDNLIIPAAIIKQLDYARPVENATQ